MDQKIIEAVVNAEFKYNYLGVRCSLRINNLLLMDCKKARLKDDLIREKLAPAIAQAAVDAYRKSVEAQGWTTIKTSILDDVLSQLSFLDAAVVEGDPKEEIEIRIKDIQNVLGNSEEFTADLKGEGND